LGFGPDKAFCWAHRDGQPGPVKVKPGRKPGRKPKERAVKAKAEPAAVFPGSGPLSSTDMETILSDIARTATTNPAARLAAIKELREMREASGTRDPAEAGAAAPENPFEALDADGPRRLEAV
jgi:hypothetical protein